MQVLNVILAVPEEEVVAGNDRGRPEGLLAKLGHFLFRAFSGLPWGKHLGDVLGLLRRKERILGLLDDYVRV